MYLFDPVILMYAYKAGYPGYALIELIHSEYKNYNNDPEATQRRPGTLTLPCLRKSLANTKLGIRESVQSTHSCHHGVVKLAKQLAVNRFSFGEVIFGAGILSA